MRGAVHLFLLRDGLHWLRVGALCPTAEREAEQERGGGVGEVVAVVVGRGIIHSLCAQSTVEITQGNDTADRGERLDSGKWGGEGRGGGSVEKQGPHTPKEETQLDFV